MRNRTDEVTRILRKVPQELSEFKEGRKEPVIKGFVRNTHI